MSARELLEHATPRPWSALFGSNVAAMPEQQEHGTFWGAIVADKTTAADSALIAAAVNEYEALLDCADLLRAATIAKEPATLGDALVDGRAALARLDAVRSGT